MLLNSIDDWKFKYIHPEDYLIRGLTDKDGWFITIMTGDCENTSIEVYDVRLLEKVNSRGHNLEFEYDIINLPNTTTEQRLQEVLLELIPDIIIKSLQVQTQKEDT